MLLALEGKVAVVTGGAQGIGRAVAVLFAEAGASVVIADIREDQAQDCATSILAAGGKAIAIRADIQEEADVEAVYAAAQQEFGGADILVHCAAIFPKYDVMEMSVEAWDKIQAVNVRGSFLLMRSAVRAMLEKGVGGAIVNVSSVSGERTVVRHNFAYGASKAALSNLTRTAALEFAKDQIRVNAVLPGGTQTEGAEEALADMDARGLPRGGPITQPGRVPLGRLATPQDIANACLFLASDAAAAITGQLLAVDGGFLIS